MSNKNRNLQRAGQNAQPNQANNLVAKSFSATAYSGPLPPPEILEKFKEIHPDAPEIIFGTFKKQSEHRMYLEKRVVDSNTFRATLGIIFGFIIAILIIGSSVFLLYNDKQTEGFTTMLVGLTSLVSVFIFGKVSNRKEREQKLQ